jgi:tetratricopeptide (TPR) repeat protein
VAAPPPPRVAGQGAKAPISPRSATLESPPSPPEEQGARRCSSAEIRAFILAAHERLKLDHFEVLGLERSATEVEVREAYATAARILHPDASLDPSLDDLREQREAVFIRLSAAYATLRNPASRAAYEQAFVPSKLRRPGGTAKPPRLAPPRPAPAAPPTPPPSAAAPPTPPPPAPAPPVASAPVAAPAPSTFDPRLTPEWILAAAAAMFAERRYWEAIQQLEPVIPRAEGATRTEAQLLLARAYLENPKWKRRAEGVLQGLLAENPRHVPALLLLAGIYRATGLAARARATYQKVLELEPGDPHARHALEALGATDKEAPRKSGLAALFTKR